MTDQPLVSIITPSYNQAAFLEETIRSVLAQDYARIEYIVIDGGSTDGSVDIIRRYADRIAHWVSEPDEGQSHAINKGFRLATGDIVAWLNSDDLYYPDAVSTAVRRFVEQPDLGLFYGHGVFIDRAGAFVRYFTEVEPYDAFRLRNCSDFIMQPTTFYRRDVLERIGLLDESLHFAMDWDLWCRFARSGCGVHFEQKLIAATRLYPETKTTAGSHARLDEIKRVWRRHRTSRWPHAVFGFRGTELRACLERDDLSFLRCLQHTLHLFFLRLGNWRNILHDQRRPNNLYGFQRRTNALLSNAHLTWPLYKEAREVALTLHTQNPTDFTVAIKNSDQPQTVSIGAGETTTVRLPFHTPPSSNVIDIALDAHTATTTAVLDAVSLT